MNISCLTIKSCFIYSYVLIRACLEGGQADIVLPPPEEKHENNASIVSYKWSLNIGCIDWDYTISNVTVYDCELNNS